MNRQPTIQDVAEEATVLASVALPLAAIAIWAPIVAVE
jgi:hypothetical protein